MRCQSINVAAGLLALLSSLQGTFAGVPAGEEWTLSEQMAVAGTNEGPMIAEDGSFEIIVQYDGKAGHDAVIKASKTEGTSTEFKVRGKEYAAITVENVKALLELENNPDIGVVDLDDEVHALVHERGPTRSLEEYRRLQDEPVPYGITIVNVSGIPAVGQAPVKVCVVDTGYDDGHEDLPSLDQVADGFKPVTGATEPWYEDGNNHGTHCAGTIGADGSDSVGVTSVNPDYNGFDFFIAKGLPNSGSGTWSNVITSMEACRDNGAKIVSMSLGGGYNNAAADAAKELYDDGVLIIAAAGNGGNSGFSYPASLPEVMSVAATNSADQRVSFSQYNSQVEIAAPGQNVWSTISNNRYAAFSGTSMATPHVAGVAARVWGHFPECTNTQIRNVLIRTARDANSGGCDERLGFGIVDGGAAYSLLLEYGCEGAGGATPATRSDHAVGGCAQEQFIPDLPTTPQTPAPATPAPIYATAAPVSTPAPITPAPVSTPAPITPAPVTVAPITPAPVSTPAPITPAPVTAAPITPAPATAAPITSAPVLVSGGDLIISAFLPNPAGSDVETEYVILKNPSSSTINFDAADYQICRQLGSTLTCKTLTGTLGPLQTYVSCKKSNAHYAACATDTHRFNLRNRAYEDTVVLMKNNEIIDQTQYGDPRKRNTGRCWTRNEVDDTFQYADCPFERLP